MLINFKKVVIHNFLSIGDAEITLDNNGIVLVEGHNLNTSDQALSNGSGKSSIFNSICWCLTGETIQGVSSDIVNIYSNDGCFVELTLMVNRDKFKITRMRDYAGRTGSDLKIIKNDQDISGKGIRESTKILESNLGELNSELIGSIIILGQGLPHKFSNNTPAGRKELLEKLSKSDFMIEDIKNRISDRKNELSDNIRQKEDQITEEKAKLSIYDDYISDSQNKLNELKEMKFDDIARLKDLLELNRDARSRLESLLKQDDDEITALTDKLVTLNTDRDEEITRLTDDYNNAVDPLKSEQSSVDKKLDDIKFKLDHADDDICPTCGQKIPDKEHIDKQPLLDEQAHLNEIWNGYQDKITELKKEFDANKSAVLNKYDAGNINSRISQVKSIRGAKQHNISELDKTIADMTNEIAVLRAEAENYQKTVEQLEQTITLNSDRKQQSEEKIVYYNEEVDELSQHLEVINQFATYVKRDFRGYLLSNVIDFIQAKSNEYSSTVFGTNLVSFQLDGNNINIAYNGKPYENLSGGEKQKIDLIVQFAIKDMLSQYLNVYCNILVLDEIFDNLDSIGCQKVLELVSSMTDVNSTYIISHHADELRISYDNKLTVVKDNSGISKVR